MNRLELLDLVVDEALKKGWKLLTHIPIVSVVPTQNEHPLTKTEYGVRKRAFTRLCQEVVYTYYVGDFFIWHRHKNYLGYITGSGVSLSSSLVNHMLQRDAARTSCFVIMSMDGLKYMPGSKLGSSLSISGVFNSLKHAMINADNEKEQDPSKTKVDMKAFTTKDPFPDHNPAFLSEQTQKELV
jgi:hypothetical protein